MTLCQRPLFSLCLDLFIYDSVPILIISSLIYYFFLVFFVLVRVPKNICFGRGGARTFQRPHSKHHHHAKKSGKATPSNTLASNQTDSAITNDFLGQGDKCRESKGSSWCQGGRQYQSNDDDGTEAMESQVNISHQISTAFGVKFLLCL